MGTVCNHTLCGYGVDGYRCGVDLPDSSHTCAEPYSQLATLKFVLGVSVVSTGAALRTVITGIWSLLTSCSSVTVLEWTMVVSSELDAKVLSGLV